MNGTRRRARCAPAGPVAALCALGGVAALADPPAAVVDSQRIINSLQTSTTPSSNTRRLVVAQRPASAETHGISLDIRFANDSDRLTDAASAQLTELGTALTSPELAHTHFLIAGHTSATGAAEHNQRLSESRARAMLSYLVQHFHTEAERLASVGYGAAHPLPDFPAYALKQRRVEISALPATF